MPQLATDDKRLRKPDKNNTAFTPRKQTDLEGPGQWKLQENREHDLAPGSVTREGPWRQPHLRAVKLDMFGVRVEGKAWGGGREGSLGGHLFFYSHRDSQFSLSLGDLLLGFCDCHSRATVFESLDISLTPPPSTETPSLRAPPNPSDPTVLVGFSCQHPVTEMLGVSGKVFGRCGK